MQVWYRVPHIDFKGTSCLRPMWQVRMDKGLGFRVQGLGFIEISGQWALFFWWQGVCRATQGIPAGFDK